MVLRKPNPPSPPNPPHPPSPPLVPLSCFIDHTKIKNHVIEKLNGLRTFYAQFVDKYGSNLNKDHVYISLINLISQLNKTADICEWYKTAQNSVQLFMGVANIYFTTNPNLIVLGQPKHRSDMLTYLDYTDFEQVLQHMISQHSICC